MEDRKRPLTYDELLEEFGQKIVLLLDVYRYELKEVARKIGMNDGNLIGVLKQTKGKKASREKLNELLKLLNAAYPAELDGFKVNNYQSFILYFQSSDKVSHPVEKGYSDLKIRVDELEITVEAQNNVFIRYIARDGTRPEDLQAEVEKEKDVLRAQKNNPQ